MNNLILSYIMRGLILLLGEAFRSGGQGSRIRGEIASYHEQEMACHSHIDFMKYLKKEKNIDMEVYISSYHTRYDKRLLKTYKNYLVGNGFYDRAMGLNRLLDESMKRIRKDRYDFIFFVRVDLFLKPFFFEKFEVWDKMKYSNICWTLHNRDHMYNNFPRVSDMMFYIPKKYYHCKVRLCHESWFFLRRQNRKIKNSDVGVIVKTFHDSDSQKDWNPIYRIVNRPESKNWYSKGQEFNINNRKDKFIDKSDIVYTIN